MRASAIAALAQEKAALESDRDLGVHDAERIAAIETESKALEEKLAALEQDYIREKALVEEIAALRVAKAASQRDAGENADEEGRYAALREKFDALDAIEPEKRMIYAHVDEQAVASVVSDWTGIPVGRMVKDEIETVLKLPETSSTGGSSASPTASR